MQPEAAAVGQHDVLARDDEPLAARAARPQRVAPVGAARRPREGLHGRLDEVLLDEARREAAGERREVALLFLWWLVRRVGVEAGDARPEAGAHRAMYGARRSVRLPGRVSHKDQTTISIFAS